MLEARKNRLFEEIFAVYNRNLFKRKFHALDVSGLKILENRRKNLPLIIYSNHSSWWDGLTVFEISRRLRLNSYVMTEEKNLERFSFLRRLGAFSVVRENPRKAVESINYAADVLRREKNSMLLIFPQGEILPNDVRPLKFYNGLNRIIEKTENAAVAPLAMRYEFLGEYKPQIFAKIGEIEYFEEKKSKNFFESNKKFEIKLTECLNYLHEKIINRDFRDFTKIV